MHVARRLPLMLAGGLLGAWALAPCVCVDDQAGAGPCGRAVTLVRPANCCGGGGDGRAGDLQGRTGCECTESRLVARVTPRPEPTQPRPAFMVALPPTPTPCRDAGAAHRADHHVEPRHDPALSSIHAARAPPPCAAVSA